MKRTIEHNQKISEALKGRKLSPESIAKMRTTIKTKYPGGRKVWNKGLTKETNEVVKAYSEKRMKPLEEKKGWLVHGYRHVSIKGKEIPEHHLNWMSANHMWVIPEGFVVHHIDGSRDNNAPENLVLMSREQHTELHHSLGTMNPYGFKT